MAVGGLSDGKRPLSLSGSDPFAVTGIETGPSHVKPVFYHREVANDDAPFSLFFGDRVLMSFLSLHLATESWESLCSPGRH